MSGLKSAEGLSLTVSMGFADGIWHFEIVEPDGDGYAFGTKDDLAKTMEAVRYHVKRILGHE